MWFHFFLFFRLQCQSAVILKLFMNYYIIRDSLLGLLQFATVYKARDKSDNTIVAIKKVRRWTVSSIRLCWTKVVVNSSFFCSSVLSFFPPLGCFFFFFKSCKDCTAASLSKLRIYPEGSLGYTVTHSTQQYRWYRALGLSMRITQVLSNSLLIS